MSGVLSLRTTLLLDLTVAAFACLFRGIGGSLVTISWWNRSGAVDGGFLFHDDSVDVVSLQFYWVRLWVAVILLGEIGVEVTVINMLCFNVWCCAKEDGGMVLLA
ncbi:hypothetical protein QL285_088606 [Trifolium repens]|jgi:hypothetical protein|nr:hypothetical protein QL285_088606 [Trifolium repens]